MRIIAITGGIGSGKSVVARLLVAMGYHAYDCDTHAMRLINEDKALRRDIVEIFGSKAYSDDGTYDRAYISERVFNDNKLLDRLNTVVHPVVINDIHSWANNLSCDLVFVESALLRQSGLILHVDEVWRVDAPLPVRVERVIQRNALTADAIMRRIQAQQPFMTPFDGERLIINDGNTPLLPQIMRLLTEH